MDLFAPSHLLILLLIILIIFGPSKLGDVGGALGKAIKDFKRAMNDQEPEKHSDTVAKSAQNPAPANNDPVKPS
jgi:sec-independent protein translocase protein TatA